MDKEHLIETHNKIREARRNHLHDSLDVLDCLIDRLFEREEYVANVDNAIDERENYMESLSLAIDFLFGLKEGARKNV